MIHILFLLILFLLFKGIDSNFLDKFSFNSFKLFNVKVFVKLYKPKFVVESMREGKFPWQLTTSIDDYVNIQIITVLTAEEYEDWDNGKDE